MDEIKGVIFDLDGIIVDTIPVHFKAWERIFNEYGKSLSRKDYEKKVDGKSEDEWARSIFIDLTDKEIRKVCEKKNRYFHELLQKEDIKIFESSITLLKQLKEEKIDLAAVSSDNNADYIQKKINLDGIFHANISGKEFTNRKLDPEIFLSAAEKIGLSPEECVVFEAARAGVEAAKQSGFFCVGVSHQYSPENVGMADVVVKDMGEITTSDLKTIFNNKEHPIEEFRLSEEEWLVKEEGYSPSKIGMYESIFTLGNGYLGHRACLGENPSGSYRGTYIAGIFDKSEALSKELVKLPVWNDFSVWSDERKFNFNTCKVLFHERTLDLRKAILHRRTRFQDKYGKIVQVESKSVVSAHEVRCAVIEYNITPINFSGKIKIISGLNGDVTNKGYFPRERIKHLNLVKMERGREYSYLEVETRDEKVKVGLASSLSFNNPSGEFIQVNRMYGEKFAEEVTFEAKRGRIYYLTKWVTIYTSREGYGPQLKDAAITELRTLIEKGEEYHLQRHIQVWKEWWERADIQILGDKRAQTSIRFNLYHLMIAKPHHDPTVGIGAKFLTGETYKGHSFWDTEIFVLPFFIYTFPEAARDLLLYRFYTLPGAIKNAEKLGCNGAKFAWESADSGEETTPKYIYFQDGKKERVWTGDEEQHIVSDVVYGLFKYVNISGDKEFLYQYGAEIVFQTARFWLSRVEERRGHWEIRKVIGPDEFHPHVDNNSFTNYMVKWHLKQAVSLYKEMKRWAKGDFERLRSKLKLTQKEIEKMDNVSENIFFPYDEKRGLIEQFEGYFDLPDFTITKWDRNGLPVLPDIHPLTPAETQLIKQADVVLLLCSFMDDFSPAEKLRNYKYYNERTMHKSSLSPGTYAIMGLEVGDHKNAYNYFLKTSCIDLLNIMKNTGEGIHGAAAGVAWKIVVNGFAGMDVRSGVLTFMPWLPKRWRELSYTTSWHGNRIKVKISHRNIELTLIETKEKNKRVNVQGRLITLYPGKPIVVKLKSSSNPHRAYKRVVMGNGISIPSF